MDREAELALAATAAPPMVTEGASYYVLTAGGYDLATAGDNGFHCFVERSWTSPSSDNRVIFDPEVRAPHCVNEVGSRSTMQEMFLVSRLALEGHDGESIRRVVDRAYADGELRLPEGLSLTYMMSRHQNLGFGLGAWRPHLMLWIPYLDGAAVGGSPPGAPEPHVFGRPGSRHSVLVIPLAEFVD